MISNILWVALFLGVTCNTCGVYMYNSSNAIQCSGKPSVFKYYFCSNFTLLEFDPFGDVTFNTDILKPLLCLCYSMTLALNFQVVF